MIRIHRMSFVTESIVAVEHDSCSMNFMGPAIMFPRNMIRESWISYIAELIFGDHDCGIDFWFSRGILFLEK